MALVRDQVADLVGGDPLSVQRAWFSSSWVFLQHFSRSSSFDVFGIPHRDDSWVGRLLHVCNVLQWPSVLLHELLESFPGCKVVVLGLVTAELTGY